MYSTRRNSSQTTDRARRWRWLGGLSLAHLVTDGYLNFPSPLLALLAARVGVGYAAAGALIGINSVFTALANVVMGLVGDRGWRWSYAVMLAGVGGTVLFMSAIGAAGSYWVLVVLCAAGAFACGAFHPPSYAMAGEVSRPKRQMGVSVLMTAGIAACGIGPVFVSYVVGWLGLSATLVCMAPGLALTGVAALLLRGGGQAVSPAREPEHHVSDAPAGKSRLWLALLFANAGLRTFAHMSVLVVISYLTVESWGLKVTASGWGVGALQVGAGLGGLVMGQLTPSGHERRGMLLCIPLGVALLVPLGLSSGRVWFLWLFLFGAAVNGPQPLALSLAQHIVPRRSAMVSGLVVGPVFSAGAAAASVAAPLLIKAVGQLWFSALLGLPLAGAWLTVWLLPRKGDAVPK